MHWLSKYSFCILWDTKCQQRLSCLSQERDCRQLWGRFPRGRTCMQLANGQHDCCLWIQEAIKQTLWTGLCLVGGRCQWSQHYWRTESKAMVPIWTTRLQFFKSRHMLQSTTRVQQWAKSITSNGHITSHITPRVVVVWSRTGTGNWNICHLKYEEINMSSGMCAHSLNESIILYKTFSDYPRAYNMHF